MAELVAACRKQGRPVHPDDECPELSWEYCAWWLYKSVETQVRIGPNGLIGIDYGPAIAIARDMGWRLVLSLALLKVIETELLADVAQRRQAEQAQS